MNWSDLRVIDTSKIATSLPAGGDLSVCPLGRVALVPAGVSIDPSAYGAGVWVSVAPMTETVKELDAADRVVATIDRESLLVASFPVVVDGATLREMSVASPEELLLALVSGPHTVHALEPGPAGT